jgi:hypothetical protein
MFDSDCPMQKAFIKHLNLICNMKESVYWRKEYQLKNEYEIEYISFVNRWCPTFKDRRGCFYKDVKEANDL